MKINEQYHNLNLLENVTYEFLGRDGEAHEEDRTYSGGTHDECVRK